MKVLRTLLTALFIALPTACGLDVVEFDVVEEGGVGLAGLSLPGLQSFGSSLSSELSAKNIDPGDVDSLRLLGADLEMTSAGGLTQDLSFIKKLDFLVSASGRQPTLLAHSPEIASGQKKVDLEVIPQLELKPYLEAGDMSISTDAQLDPPPPDRVDLKLAFHLRVDVNL